MAHKYITHAHKEHIKTHTTHPHQYKSPQRPRPALPATALLRVATDSEAPSVPDARIKSNLPKAFRKRGSRREMWRQMTRRSAAVSLETYFLIPQICSSSGFNRLGNVCIEGEQHDSCSDRSWVGMRTDRPIHGEEKVRGNGR